MVQRATNYTTETPHAESEIQRERERGREFSRHKVHLTQLSDTAHALTFILDVVRVLNMQHPSDAITLPIDGRVGVEPDLQLVDLIQVIRLRLVRHIGGVADTCRARRQAL